MLLVTGYLVASTAPLLLPVLVGFAIPTMVLEVRHARRRAELEEKLAPEWGGLWDDLRNLMVAPSLAMLHQFGAATWFSRRYRLGLQSASKTEGTLENDAALKRVLAALLVAMGILLSLWTLLYRALSGDLTVGGLLLTTGAIAGLTGSLAEFASLMGQQWSQSKSIKDLTEFLEHPYSSAISTRYVPIEQEYGCEESTEGTVADGGDATITDHLVLEDVWYRYPSAATERYAVRGLSFSVKRGSVVALVGPNGAGKSSTMGLMLRQLQPTRGSISINGKSIDQMTAEEFSGQVIMLPQELQHLNLTLRELLNLGRPLDPAPDDAVWRALEHVGAAEFVRKWKNGLDTCLGHGRREAMEPSGGQLQRLLLTAVVIADRGLIVLDEPVSKVDSNAAKWFWNALFKEAKNRTVIFSTHQLGAVRRANMILFIADGSVTAQGTHDELMESCKAYRQLFDDQAGDYL
jgi:ABC-type multidrug transport system fused ATPase/permease subunit